MMFPPKPISTIRRTIQATLIVVIDFVIIVVISAILIPDWTGKYE